MATMYEMRELFSLLRSDATRLLTDMGEHEKAASVPSFIAKVAREKTDNPTPEDWIRGAEAAKKWAFKIAAEREGGEEGFQPCERCGQTGRFITGSHNGQLTGPGGPCFRCAGRGQTTRADRIRNFWYDVSLTRRA